LVYIPVVAGEQKRRAGFLTASVLLCLSFAGLPEAHAQSEAPKPPRYVLPITLAGSRPGLRLTIRSSADPRDAWHCDDACHLALIPGLYQVGVVEDGERSSRRIRIHQAERLTLTPPSREARDIGAGLAIGGAVLGGLGGAAFLYGIWLAIPCGYAGGPADGCPERPRAFVYGGLAGVAAGVAVSIPGIVLMFENRGPRVEVEPFGRVASGRAPALYFMATASGAPLGFRVGAAF
jgi:hypothetical protein